MKVLMCEQGTPEWLDARCGIATASEFGNILTPKRGDLSSGWKAYAAQLIAERLTGGPDPWRYEGETVDMRRGREFEPEAREFFAFTHNVEVEQVGFCIHDNGRWGCSPDGLIGDGAGLELKCPAPKTQIKWVYENELPEEHKNQCHGGMIVTGRDTWWFMSYCAGCPSLVVEVKRDDYTKRLEEALLKFNKRFDDMLAVIMERRERIIEAKIAQKGDQLEDANRSLVPPQQQYGWHDDDPFGPELF